MLQLTPLAGLFDLDAYLRYGVDAGVYFLLAMIATLLFLAKLGLQLFAGDPDIDFDVDGGDAGHADSTGAFTFFSILSVLAFFMGVGWMGLASRVSWGWSAPLSAAAATAFGLLMMGIASGLMYAVRQMSEEGRYDLNTAIGSIGRVYLTVPARGQGRGQVEVTVSGRSKVIDAVSEGEAALPAFTAVRIVSLRDDQAYVVEPVD